MTDSPQPTRGKRTRQSDAKSASLASPSRLLVPLDGSQLAEAILPIADRLAEAGGATISLLHVIEKAAPTEVHGERHLTSRPEAEAYLSEIARRLREAGRRVEYHVHEVPVGNVAQSIAAHAEEKGSDLILISTHGEGGIREAIWGTIAQQVLHLSTRPVLLVQARPETHVVAFAPRTIMVPLDATAAAEGALPLATALAQQLDTRLRLVMVVPTLETVTAEQVPTATFLPSATRVLFDIQEKQANAYLEQLAEAARAAGVVTQAEVRRGSTVDELAIDTGEHADGLIVIATHGRAGLQSIWTPSVAARLLRRTRVPILLVPIVEPNAAAEEGKEKT
ncbi:MAG TPA: universal stress protein [Chloroflexota bacterium]|nr:universal stress protein [Chloroflexota bacterium]